MPPSSRAIRTFDDRLEFSPSVAAGWIGIGPPYSITGWFAKEW